MELYHLIPVDVLKRYSTHYVISVPLPPPLPSPPIPPSTSWFQYVNGLPHWEKQILHDNNEDISHLWKDLLQPQEVWTIVSNGSCSNNKATYAWIIMHKNNLLVSGTRAVYGNPPLLLFDQNFMVY